MRCGVGIQSDADGSTPVGAERLAEECLGRRNVSLWTQPEVDRIALLVHGTVEIDPSAAHLQIRLVDAPRVASLACIASPTLFELRDIPLDPTHDGRVSKLQSTFCHHLDKIPEAELITKVPTYAQQDHLTIEVPTRKHCLRSFPITHTSTKLPKITLYPNGELTICTRALLVQFLSDSLVHFKPGTPLSLLLID
jgi:hypothetical protein